MHWREGGTFKPSISLKKDHASLEETKKRLDETIAAVNSRIQTSLPDAPTPKSEKTELDSPPNSQILKLKSKWAAIRISGDDVAIVGIFGSYEDAALSLD